MTPSERSEDALEAAAEEYFMKEHNNYFDQRYNEKYIKDEFKAGAKWERERILGMLRGADADLEWAETHNCHSCHDQDDWADWLEERLK